MVSRIYKKIAPVQLAANQEEYGSYLNSSATGADLQHIFTNVQVNIACAELYNASQFFFLYRVCEFQPDLSTA